MPTRPKFIVGEVSKNWFMGTPVFPFISMLFEQLLEENHKEGYRLHSFQLHRISLSESELNETIIAVFELRDDAN